MHKPFNPYVVVVKVIQDAATGYNESVVLASWHMLKFSSPQENTGWAFRTALNRFPG